MGEALGRMAHVDGTEHGGDGGEKLGARFDERTCIVRCDAADRYPRNTNRSTLPQQIERCTRGQRLGR